MAPIPYDEEYVHRWQAALTAVSVTLVVLSTLVYCVRIYASHVPSRKVRCDEILMTVGVFLMWGHTASLLLKVFEGIHGSDDAGNVVVDVNKMHRLGLFLVVRFWATSMMCVKLSIIVFLKHLLCSSRRAGLVLTILAGAIVIWGFFPLFSAFFSCNPRDYFGDESVEVDHCIQEESHKNKVEGIIIGLFSLMSDIVILVIPVPTVWNSKMKLKQKIAVAAIFAVGGIVCVFALLRCIQFAYSDGENFSTASNLLNLWTILENGFAIICGCLPQLKPLFRRFLSDSPDEETFFNRPYRHSNSGPKTMGFPLAGVRTLVSSGSSRRACSAPPQRRNSSEIELQGIIKIHTTFDREVSVEAQERERSLKVLLNLPDDM